MKETNENFNNNDGKQRIDMPKGIKHAGFDIRKCISILAIIGLFVFYVVLVVGQSKKREEEAFVSRFEWLEMLSESFGDDSILADIDEAEKSLTGEFAVNSVMSLMGEERLANILGDEEASEEKIIEAAIEVGIIEKNQLEEKITEEEAAQIVLNALDVYYAPEYYPLYFDAESQVDCINVDAWDGAEIDETEKTITATLSEAPEVGEYIVYTDEFGMANVRTVTKVVDQGKGNYKIETENMDETVELMEYVSFSGTGDFSYLLRDESMNNNSEAGEEGITLNNPYSMTVHAAEPREVAEIEWFEDKTAVDFNSADNGTSKCDIEICAELTFEEEQGVQDVGVSSQVKISENGLSTTYKYEDGKLEVSAEAEFEGFSIELEEGGIDGLEDVSMKDEQSISVGVNISDLSICTSGYYQWADPDDEKNHVEVLASAEKVDISTSLKITAEDQYLLATLPIPIAATGGTIGVNLSIYLVVSASGELTLYYEINEPYVGICASVGEGVQFSYGYESTNAGIRAKIELGAGFIGEAAIVVLNEFKIANPGIDTRAYATVSTIDIKEDYELKPDYIGTTCFELKGQAPIIKITAAASDDSVLSKILDSLNLNISYEIIGKDSDNVPWKVTYHVEYENDGTLNCVQVSDPETHEDICTHIQLKEPEGVSDIVDGIEEKIDEEVEGAKEELENAAESAKEELENAAEAALEEWLEENLSGCCY